MKLPLILSDYPNLSVDDINKVSRFLSTKCSEYRFIDFMRCSKGNVKDAIEFFKFDDALRALLIQYLIRFEIQVKTDFVREVEAATGSNSFWDNPLYYFKSSTTPYYHDGKSKFDKIKDDIIKNINRYAFNTPGPSDYRALMFSSFGSFHNLFKNIDLPYKKKFIDKYTLKLPVHNYYVLNGYFSAIQAIRNRCAHGNHIVTIKLKNQLNAHISLIHKTNSPKPKINISVFDAVLIFLINVLNCGGEFKGKLKKIITKYNGILSRYPGNYVFSINIINKIL